jgi:plasmid stabilization system protein ParE
MAHFIIWSQRAAEDLESIAEYIARDSEAYASSVVRTIIRKAGFLCEFPYAGRIVPEFDDESIREVFACSYRIIYQVQETNVRIAAVIHGRREIDASLKP